MKTRIFLIWRRPTASKWRRQMRTRIRGEMRSRRLRCKTSRSQIMISRSFRTLRKLRTRARTQPCQLISQATSSQTLCTRRGTSSRSNTCRRESLSTSLKPRGSLQTTTMRLTRGIGLRSASPQSDKKPDSFTTH